MKIKKCVVFIVIIVIIVIIGGMIFFINKSENGKNIDEKNNEISITEEEIDFEMQKENIPVQNRQNEESIENAKEELIEKKIISKECDKRNIQLDATQEEEFRNKAFVEELSEEDKEYAERTGMTEEEIRQAIYDLSVEMQKEVKLYDALLKEIYNNEVTIDNQEFKNKVNEYNENRNSENVDFDYNFNELQKLTDEYFNLIKEQYIINS